MGSRAFFEWADECGLSITDIAARLGYTERSVYRHKAGTIQDTTNFALRAIAAFGDQVRPFFNDVVYLPSHTYDPVVTREGRA